MLYLFSTSFPYGADGVFLGEEINYLSNAFERIVIVPLENFSNNTPVPLPSNVEVTPPLLKSRTRYQLYRLFDIKLYPVFFKDLIKNKVYINRTKFKEWILSFVHASAILRSESITEIDSKITKNDICYFYWGHDAYILAYFWRNRATFLSRFHGSCDLWEEKTAGYKALRAEVMKSLKYAVPISEKGKLYLKNKYPFANVVTSRLGTSDHGISSKSNDNILRVVSCSNVIPLKRVNLIFEALNSMCDKTIEWTHIGGGSEFVKLRSLINKEKASHLIVHLTGVKKHEEVMTFYKEHKIDIFINLSTIEGIPVSAMEAISFNIPVVATDVGATSEIVTKETGVLVSCNPTLNEIADAINEVLTKNLTPRNFWAKYYEASKNYINFISLLKE